MPEKATTTKTSTKKTAAKEAPAKKAPAKEATAKKAAAAPAKKTAAPKETKTWHVTKREEDGKWVVKAEGNSKATKLFKTKKEAEEYVKTLTANNEGSRAVSHKKDGKFQKK